MHDHAGAVRLLTDRLHRSHPTPPWSLDAAVALCRTDDDGNPEHRRAVVVVGRRAAKTTTLLDVAVARCLAFPGYRVAYAAQTLVRGYERFSEALDELEASPLRRAFRSSRNLASAGLHFGNGSKIRVLAPRAASFRSAAYDLAILDEAQEHSEAAGADLVAGLWPTGDTRPGFQLVVAGTAGPVRAGLLWDRLQQARAGSGLLIEYAATDDDDLDDPAVWARVHPGVGYLTPLERLHDARQTLGVDRFNAEYLGVWGTPADELLPFPAIAWRECATRPAPRPARVAVGIDAEADGSGAVAVAAWRVNGAPHIELLREPTTTADGMVDWLTDLGTRRDVSVGFDASGPLVHVADALTRLRRQPHPVTAKTYLPACAELLEAVTTRQLRHPDQATLNAHFTEVRRRTVGDRWVWNRRGGPPMAAVAAATVALRTFDDTRPLRPPTAR